ncbi:MAG: S8 family serine peptidase, partial [Bacteroidetes bacterium]|nr:S8 family serine peptidase [Fibrella sp.]
VSTRAISPLMATAAQADVAVIEPAFLPFYTIKSGTSMSTPHVAGIVALMLEAKPSLSPAQVKEIIQKTATNMPNRESWEVGAGYVNAYAAVDMVFRSSNFGSTVNSTRAFVSSVNSQAAVQPFTVDFNPALTAGNQFTFNVAPGTNSIEVKIAATGLLGQTGNVINLIVLDPSGLQYRSGIPALFALTVDRSVAVAAPPSGTWTVRLEGLNGVALPETITGTISRLTASGTSGLGDIVGHPAEASIKTAINSRLMDGLNGGFKPKDALKRIQLADYLLMGQAIRQYLPTTGVRTYSDLGANDVLLAESVSARGAALRDQNHQNNGVMLPTADGKFSPTSNADRVTVAYALVQGLGFQRQALERNGRPVSVQVEGKSIPIDDAATIPAAMEGYVSIALELNLINAFFTSTQGAFDLKPVIRATFKPKQTVTRGEFAVIVTRTFPHWEAVTQPAARMAAEFVAEPNAYPNLFSGSTTIRYTLPQADYVTVEVYNVLGSKVKTLVQAYKPAGSHDVTFDGSQLSSGTYLYKVNTSTGTSARRMILN